MERIPNRGRDLGKEEWVGGDRSVGSMGEGTRSGYDDEEEKEEEILEQKSCETRNYLITYLPFVTRSDTVKTSRVLPLVATSERSFSPIR